MANKKYLSTKQVSVIFDVDESTVRRWVLNNKIECSSSAGGHRKFSYKNIIDFSSKKGIKIEKSDKSNNISHREHIDKILKHIFSNDIRSIEIILIQLYLNGILLVDIMDNYIEKILVKIQNKLDKSEISIAEEHIARKIISKALNNFKLTVGKERSDCNKNILCLNLENDIPDLPIDMIQILLENNNFNVDNCGSNTDTKDIKKLLSNKKYEAIFIYLCDRQCCTSTVKDNLIKTNKDLEAISDLAQEFNIKLFLGGPSFKNINKNILKKYTTFTKYSESLQIS